MKNIKTYLILLLTSSASVSYGVTLPSHPFFDTNELYEEGHDYVEYSVGTQIRNLNIVISDVIDSWGNTCWEDSFHDRSKCADCCGDTWDSLEEKEEDDELKYDRCLEICGEGTSLPLGSTLWMLPFVFAYAGIKKYRKAQMNITQVL